MPKTQNAPKTAADILDTADFETPKTRALYAACRAARKRLEAEIAETGLSALEILCRRDASSPQRWRAAQEEMGADLLSILDAKPFRQLAALDALEASPDIAARLSVGQEQVEEIEAAIERESAEAESHRADLESRLAAKREEIEQRVAELRASGVAALEAEVEEILGELNQLPAVHR